MEFDVRILAQLANDQQVPQSTVITTVEQALTDAYARTPAAAPGAKATVDMTAGKISITDIDGNDVTPTDFGRLAAATARQAVVQWLRDVERIRKVGVWAGREGTLVTGTVRAHAARNKRGETIVDLGGGIEAVLPAGEATPGEEYRHGTELTAIIVAVNVDDRDRLKITISRRQPTLISELIAKYSPEVSSGRVRVVAIARDPGSRAKVAVAVSADRNDATGVDPVAAVIGPAAERIRRVVADVAGEKIDVVAYHPDLAAYVAAALTPAKIGTVEVLDVTRKAVRAFAARDHVALAVGTAGTNARLASRLTGAKIEVVPAA